MQTLQSLKSIKSNPPPLWNKLDQGAIQNKDNQNLSIAYSLKISQFLYYFVIPFLKRAPVAVVTSKVLELQK